MLQDFLLMLLFKGLIDYLFLKNTGNGNKKFERDSHRKYF